MVRPYFDTAEGFAVKEAWKMPYNGENHQLLLNNINNMKRGEPYSNTVAIIQSSGSGKSRLVHEQSNLVFTLPFNLRWKKESEGMAYPHPDNEIRDHLIRGSHLQKSQIECLQLLANVFSLVSKVLDGWTQTENAVWEHLSQAERWRAYMDERDGENREKLYAEAVQLCTQNQLREWQERHADSSLSHVDVVIKEAKERLTDLLQQIDDCGTGSTDAGTQNVKLMLYFDEAHVLTINSIDAPGWNMYDVLCWSLNFFRLFPIFAIFISTDPIVNQLASATSGSRSSSARSARMREHLDALQAPITETPFDCSPDIEVTPGELKLDDLCRVRFLAGFGRPMWWTMLPRVETQYNSMSSAIIHFARAKLICHSNIQLDRHSMPDIAVIAILDVLLSLDLESSRENVKKIEEEMVAGHMRTLFWASSDRAHFHSGYPSEPILAEAAARQINELQSQEPNRNVMAVLLTKPFDQGLIDRRLRGELVWRQLVMEAYLRAVRTEQNKYREAHRSSQYNFSTGCPLITFINELFSDTYAKLILDSVPDNSADMTKFANAFEHAWVRFTHFGRASDDMGMLSSVLLAAFIRGMAMICSSSRNRVILCVPVLLYPNEPLGESSMTAMLMQVKLRQTPALFQKCSIDEDDVGLFMDSASDQRPYIALVAELGTRMQTLKVARPSRKVSSKPGTPGYRMQTAPGTETGHPRYSIFAHECSSKVYRVIHLDSEGWLYEHMLADPDQHCRQDDASVAAMQRQKPVWTAGEGSYHWIKLPMLRDDKAWEDAEDGVTVGASVELEDEPEDAMKVGTHAEE